MRLSARFAESSAMTNVPPGGPSTISGILYQMLHALLAVGSLATQQRQDDNSGKPLDVTLILEPEDGGDQQRVSAGHRVVEQLKSRSGHGTWSLQEIVTEVFPDLYRAVDLEQPNTEYCFITEGRMGDWNAAYEFFHSLRQREEADDILECLDDFKEIRFRRARRSKDTATKSFWDAETYTEKSLFESIVAYLRSVSNANPEAPRATRKKVWHLLANFVFDGGHTIRSTQDSVDACLKGLVPALENLPTIRDALLLDLARQATAGGARIAANKFLSQCGLNATPLSDWRALTDNATRHFWSVIERQNISLSEEARPEFSTLVFDRWPRSCPVLILSGESGQGKTWTGFSLLRDSLRCGEIVVAVEARGDADRTQDAAARQFWQEIVGHDNVLPFARVCERLRQVKSGQQGRRVTLLIDGVHDHTEAARLAQVPWEDWDVRTIITCLPDVVRIINDATTDERAIHVSMPDFSFKELQQYLAATVGDHWAMIPQDVQNTLRRPLLARIYRELAEGGVWQPIREYELYEKVWNRILQSAAPCDGVVLENSARSVLEGQPYPWSLSQLVGNGMDNATIQRLLKLGWLVLVNSGHYKIWHDRLLNWAVAEGIVSAVRDGRLNEADALQQLRALHQEPWKSTRPFLGYVIMDVLWIANDPASGMESFATQVLKIMERFP